MKLGEKPDVRWEELKRTRRRMPAPEEQRHTEPADGEHPEVFRHEKRGIFESRILGHVPGDDFRFAFGHVERRAVRFHQTGYKK